ncbi:MAG: AAA family ATPase [Bdellovibrionales bacterium]
MSNELEQIVKQLTEPRVSQKKITQNKVVASSIPKVQLIYAFNGVGKTRLSSAFKKLIVAQAETEQEPEEDSYEPKVIYYNAFTEDLFYWDNDLEGDLVRKLRIQPNSYTNWVLQEQGQDQNAIEYFQRFTNSRLTPHFNNESKIETEDGKIFATPAFSEVTFSFEKGDDDKLNNVKISKGEESVFIWSIFYSFLEQVIAVLNTSEPEQRETNRYNKLEYVFIDDPVSSLDENNLIELAVNLAGLIKSSESDLKFIVTTHSPLFYNVLHNELNKPRSFMLERFEDGAFSLEEKLGDSNKSFSYHLHIKKVLEHAIEKNQIEKFHFTLLRNLYEKTASFLGYGKWQDLLETVPGNKGAYLKRMINFSSHRTLSGEEIRNPAGPEKETLKLLFDNLTKNYGYLKEK